MMTWRKTGGIGARMSDLGEVSRKLVAVFAADVEGYSRLMGTDEVSTLKGLTESRAILDNPRWSASTLTHASCAEALPESA